MTTYRLELFAVEFDLVLICEEDTEDDEEVVRRSIAADCIRSSEVIVEAELGKQQRGCLFVIVVVVISMTSRRRERKLREGVRIYRVIDLDETKVR